MGTKQGSMDNWMKIEVILSVEEEMNSGHLNPTNGYSVTVHEICLSRPIYICFKRTLWSFSLLSLCSCTSVLENLYLLLQSYKSTYASKPKLKIYENSNHSSPTDFVPTELL